MKLTEWEKRSMCTAVVVAFLYVVIVMLNGGF